MTSPEMFDETYFERGRSSGVSLYENYCWRPEISIPIALHLKARFPMQSILDFGCAKGFIVKALRQLGVEAWGYDISTYAIGNAPVAVKDFVTNDFSKIPNVGALFVKDTFEHIPKDEISGVVRALRGKCGRGLVIVPLGDNGIYRIPEYAFDKTHLIAENQDWWKRLFLMSGFNVDRIAFKMKGFKENWSNFRQGNGFFLLS